MCGIAGAIGNLPTNVIKRMVAKIAHRGPDNLSTLTFNDVHLAHARLSIIDLNSKSNQPLWDDEKKACIVFNGEIYNYLVLKEELIAKGYKFNSNGDAEVLLNLYLEYNAALFPKLSGIFAFAIWDNEKKVLLIARDNFGVKPLYYAQNSSGFFFASEIKALLEIDSIKKSLNYNALFRTLVFLWSPGEETLLGEIKKLKPAHYALIKDRKIIDCEPYWQWPKYSPINSSAVNFSDMIFDTLQMAVKEQLVADVPVGAFLSGGLDSSLLVGLTAKNSSSNIQCFTIDANKASDYYDKGIDDVPYASRVASLFNAELHILQVTPDLMSLLPQMIYYLDELQADPAPLNVLLICEEAKKHGIKVLLSGAGGDDIFSGYRRHFAITLEKYWTWLPLFAKKFLKHATSSLPKSNAKLRKIAKAFQYTDLAQNERILSYFYWLDPKIAFNLFNDDIKLQISPSPMQFLLDELNALETSDPLEKMLHLEHQYFLVDHNFNYTDKMSMANGIEVRVPFLDKRVISAASQVPSNLKQKGKTGKWILKKAAEKILPKEIIYRPKTGFGAPLRTWLKKDLAPMVEHYLSAEVINKRGIFNAQKIKEFIELDRKGKQDFSYPILALLSFEIWCQQFLDGEPLNETNFAKFN